MTIMVLFLSYMLVVHYCVAEWIDSVTYKFGYFLWDNGLSVIGLGIMDFGHNIKSDLGMIILSFILTSLTTLLIGSETINEIDNNAAM